MKSKAREMTERMKENPMEKYTYDFSVNINPLGLPEGVIPHVAASLEQCRNYPDPSCGALGTLLSGKYLLPKERFFFGNGADDLLYRIVCAFQPRRALIIEPAFEEYERALRTVSCQIVHGVLPEARGFAFPEDLPDLITGGLDMVFLCNPNNPTGAMCPLPILRKILDRARERRVTVVADECFMEFVPEWRSCSAKALVEEYGNLIVIDAFTKIYALAGFRLGFCVCGDPEMLRAIARHGQSYGVSGPAQAAGIGALKSEEYLPSTYRLVVEEREFLMTGLAGLPLKVYPSRTNFLLFHWAFPLLADKLKRYGIKVRDCSEFYSLDSLYHRIAVSTHENNRYLLQALGEILS